MIKGWRYYKKALLPECAPHQVPDVSQMEKKNFWLHPAGKPIFARWTSDFDCDMETEWWYVIKDDYFDISELKVKRRYEINKGKKNFCVHIINPKQYVKELILIQKKAYEQYPIKYRPIVNEYQLTAEILSWINEIVVFGAFSKENGSLSGYAMIIENDEYANFAMLKTIPEFEKNGVNAALVAGILDHYNHKLSSNYYICDGERAMLHETNFQEYLEKYFGFRKAYCKLHVKFRFPFSLFIKILTPFDKFLKCNNRIVSKVKVLIQYKRISDKNFEQYELKEGNKNDSINFLR